MWYYSTSEFDSQYLLCYYISIMSAFHLAGPSGSGKSTVGSVLQAQGFRVIETDFEQGLSGWFDNATGLGATENPPQPYTKEWVTSHSWLWNQAIMNTLLSTVGTDPVFFCGGAYNEKAFYGAFKNRFGLYVDNSTLIERLQQREPERWVEGSAELERVIVWNEKFKAYCIATGAVVIDSSLSPNMVANAILQHI